VLRLVRHFAFLAWVVFQAQEAQRQKIFISKALEMQRDRCGLVPKQAPVFLARSSWQESLVTMTF
jgi:hypothetical protein